MLRVLEYILAASGLDDPPVIHHRHTVGDIFDNGQVVRNKQHREPELSLDVLQQIEDLRLDGNVERRHGLIANDQVRA